MKLRIITNGKTFRIEQKQGFFHYWTPIDHKAEECRGMGTMDLYWNEPIHFATYEKALNFVTDKFGTTSLKTVLEPRPWRMA